MILLDTNVVSEVMTRGPHPLVRAWLDAQATDTLFICSITVAEILFGVGAKPVGKRKVELAIAADDIFETFSARILPFDTAAARCHANLAVKARVAGLGFHTPDGYIAAIAATHGFAVATRDDSAFVAAGVRVINPWS